MPIKVLIADDHALIRTGIRNELSPYSDFTVIGEATSGNEVISLATSLQPDIVLLDVNMPGIKAYMMLQEIKRICNTCRVLILTAYGDIGTVRGMINAGADGYMLKDDDPNLIPEAIKSINNGNAWFSAQISSLVSNMKKEDKKAGWNFTPRENEVFQLILEGHTNKEICFHLKTAESTVEFHIGHILKKIGGRNRLDIIVWAREHGIN